MSAYYHQGSFFSRLFTRASCIAFSSAPIRLCRTASPLADTTVSFGSGTQGKIRKSSQTFKFDLNCIIVCLTHITSQAHTSSLNSLRFDADGFKVPNTLSPESGTITYNRCSQLMVLGSSRSGRDHRALLNGNYCKQLLTLKYRYRG